MGETNPSIDDVLPLSTGTMHVAYCRNLRRFILLEIRLPILRALLTNSYGSFTASMPYAVVWVLRQPSLMRSRNYDGMLLIRMLKTFNRQPYKMCGPLPEKSSLSKGRDS